MTKQISKSKKGPTAWSWGRERNRKDLLAAMGFLLPNFLGFLVFTTVPFFFSLAMSFTNWDIRPRVPLRWVGLENFAELARDPKFWQFFYNTVYLMAGIPISIAGSLILALILNQKLRGIVFYRTMFYIPTLTSGVALFVMWKAIYNPDFGFLNVALHSALTHLGFHIPFDRLPKWHLDAVWSKPALMIMGTWTAVGGGNMLLYLAGLSNIPPELYEAADLDGAGPWARFWQITWPQLAPTTFFVVVMSAIYGLQGGFEQARVMTNGGPAESTTTLGYYIYIKAFEEFQFGYASTIAWTLFALILAVTLLNWRYGSRHIYE